jgi:hypothetical protein
MTSEQYLRGIVNESIADDPSWGRRADGDDAALTRMQRVDLVALAIAQGHPVRRCSCGSAIVMSQTRPIGQCLACRRIERVTTELVETRRWRCERCRGYYRARVGRPRCPGCRQSVKRAARRETQGSRKAGSMRTSGIA